mmetsp:Transcript_9515/g.13954  ORF Transcript_9515/g.13954 Transcript_9515/m.13954 type:complete len:118 (-) Transcript_9515:18-371(-)|eukprot:CAMPEP_0194034330 /NCGR_PEP_ID=MMETSP0009_2-20130614/6732_1 /TAXON_ID=210454 /ORGANISM="Grammatophora oceanica, Strain CCMP 410" /LENGTH=117 /DNA_ID=CAMNT_0038675189 /DNA_START=190 /DNA_END=543 /DNA_ORIENTATION=+
MAYRTEILAAVEELRDNHIRSSFHSIEKLVRDRHYQDWNYYLFRTTLKSMAEDGDIEVSKDHQVGLSPEYKKKRMSAKLDSAHRPPSLAEDTVPKSSARHLKSKQAMHKQHSSITSM